MSLKPETDLLQLAASGCASAHRELTTLAIEAGQDGRLGALEAIVSAELWSRLAAHDGTDGDVHRLAAVLMVRASYERLYGDANFAAIFDGEALAILDIAADGGDEHAALLIASVVGIMPAEGFLLAREFSRSSHAAG